MSVGFEFEVISQPGAQVVYAEPVGQVPAWAEAEEAVKARTLIRETRQPKI
jgi:hypothetical protein